MAGELSYSWVKRELQITNGIGGHRNNWHFECRGKGGFGTGPLVKSRPQPVIASRALDQLIAPVWGPYGLKPSLSVDV
jgi:hypothetical protein